MEGRRLSLVLPAYNEQAGLRQAIAEADEALARLCVEYEILVVDDGSRDGTAAVAREELAQRPNVRLLSHETNRGYGAALRTGFESARHELVAFTDADCQFHLDDLAALLPVTDVAPIVVGYRVDRKDPWRRCFLSRGYNLLARTLLGTRARDIDCALKVFRRDAVATILPEARGFFVNTEMLTRAAQEGLDVQEVGVRHRPRLHGTSTVSLREVPRTLGHLLPFWWSRVLFGGGNPLPSHSSSRVCFRGLALVLLVACLLFFSRLRAPLLEPQEARYAEIPRQMLALGDLLVPSLHGDDYLDKPPLFYWAVMASYQIFGVHDWAARVVPGLAGVLTVLLTYLWGRRAFGERVGFYAALVLCLMPGFIYRARMLTFDTLLMLWVVAALALAHAALIAPRRSRVYWLLSACACGLGLLTKGPVAVALVVVPIVFLVALDARLNRVSLRGWTAYLVVALAVAAPWYVAVTWHEPGFLTEFFWKHNVVRFVAPFDHSKPAWYYLPGLLLGLSPWWLLGPGLVGFLRERGAAARRPAALGFVLFSCAWMIVFFSASGCKRPTYLLPALPPLALVFGWCLHQDRDKWRMPSLSASAATGLVLAGSAGVCLLAGTLGFLPAAQGYALAAVAVGGLAGVVLLSQQIAWRHAAAAVFAASLVGVQVFLPAYNDLFSLRSQLRRTAGMAERGGRVVVCYPQRYDSVSYYLRSSEVRVFGAGQRNELIAHLARHPGTLLLVKTGSALEGLLKELPRDVEFRARRSRSAFVVGRVMVRGQEPERLLAFED